MGEKVEQQTFTGADRTAYQQKLTSCLDVLEYLLADGWFEAGQSTVGMEIELNLVDRFGDPAMRNTDVLAAIADPAYQTELGQFNIEINVAPRDLPGALNAFEKQLRENLNAADFKAKTVGAGIVMVGILPTLRHEHLTSRAISANPRYALLGEQILRERGEDLQIRIDGAEQLFAAADTIIPEAACTSTQLHLQVSPDQFAPYWNAAQAVAGVQVAMGANSPFLLGRQLWHETRLPLFEQATDARSKEIRAQGALPRVWFGDHWITSVFDLFEENVRFFPALLPIVAAEDPHTSVASGTAPRLRELCLHNGTIYRWNRPVYDIANGRPHVRVENRVLPAGPTVVDTMANAAFYFGLVRALADDERPIWNRMPFVMAADNLTRAARDGIEATLAWPEVGEVPARELVLRRLLPLAHDGLAAWGVGAMDRERLLGIIERRCEVGLNGAVWQVATVHQLEERHNLTRPEALRTMLRRYTACMHNNLPVHGWPTPVM